MNFTFFISHLSNQSSSLSRISIQNSTLKSIPPSPSTYYNFMVEIRYYRIDRYQNRAKLLTESYNNVARRRLLDKIYIYIYIFRISSSLASVRNVGLTDGQGSVVNLCYEFVAQTSRMTYKLVSGVYTDDRVINTTRAAETMNYRGKTARDVL